LTVREGEPLFRRCLWELVRTEVGLGVMRVHMRWRGEEDGIRHGRGGKEVQVNQTEKALSTTIQINALNCFSELYASADSNPPPTNPAVSNPPSTTHPIPHRMDFYLQSKAQKKRQNTETNGKRQTATVAPDMLPRLKGLGEHCCARTHVVGMMGGLGNAMHGRMVGWFACAGTSSGAVRGRGV
jgi:hypothetical protein